jgi:hypothetical protein
MVFLKALAPLLEGIRSHLLIPLIRTN